MTESTALARPEDDLVGRTFHRTDHVNAKLKLAEQQFNLVAPATRVGSLPPGCGVAMSVVQIDPTIDNYGSGPDCFKVDGGKLSPHRHVFDRISAALGVSWDPRHSRRLDDGKDPHYCRYIAVGHYRSFDGQLTTVNGEYELDLRDGSERALELLEKAEAAPANKRADAMVRARKALRQMRKFILQRSETGARTRAIASTGFKRAYTPDELKRPFVIAKLQWDGQTDDPELKKVLATETARLFLGGTQALYGGPPAPTPAVEALPAPVLDTEGEDCEPDHGENADE